MIEINKWVGRLGNNIKQLKNVIDIAIAYKHNIIISAESGASRCVTACGVDVVKFFDLSVIERYFNKYNNTENIKDNGDNHVFFNIENDSLFPKEIFTQNAEERNKLLKKSIFNKRYSKTTRK